MKTRFTIALLLLASLAVTPAWAEQLLVSTNEAATLICRQVRTLSLACDLRTEDADETTVAAGIGNLALPVQAGERFSQSDAQIAVLFLVDTSDPARAATLTQIRRQITSFIEQSDEKTILGLARFDSDIEMLATPGSDKATLTAAANTLAAIGKTTELYRAVRQATRALANVDARRRYLFLFSDGLAEDTAYTHEDALLAARNAGVSIIGIGYPRSVAQSVALQTVRKLAEDSGGQFVQANAAAGLPVSFHSAPYAGLMDGRVYEIDLEPAQQMGLGDVQTITFNVASATQRFGLNIPVKLPPVSVPADMMETIRETVSEAIPEQLPVAAPPPPPRATGPVERSPAQNTSISTWIWFGTPAAMLLAVLIALIVYWRSMRRNIAAPATPAGQTAEYAYLIERHDESARHVITGSPYRIGRSKNNELTVDDNSVSRQHAEIHRRHDGSFAILDLDSLNGVFVNEKKIKNANLNEGDDVDIGDVQLRFTLYDDDKAAMEPTVMIGTRAPE